MTTTMTHARRALSILVILPFMLGIGLSTALSHPKEVSGFGEAKAITTIHTTMLEGGFKAQESVGKDSL
jgi:hypothetical protein